MRFFGPDRMVHHPDYQPHDVMAWEEELPLLNCESDFPRRTTDILKTMAAFADQCVTLVDSLPNPADRFATV